MILNRYMKYTLQKNVNAVIIRGRFAISRDQQCFIRDNVLFSFNCSDHTKLKVVLLFCARRYFNSLYLSWIPRVMSLSLLLAKLISLSEENARASPVSRTFYKRRKIAHPNWRWRALDTPAEQFREAAILRRARLRNNVPSLLRFLGIKLRRE